MATADTSHSIKVDEDDLKWEEEIVRNPYVQSVWVSYIDSKSNAKENARFLLYERAVRCLPWSYKLWFSYLKERISSSRATPPSSEAWSATNEALERALLTLYRMPKVWELYLSALETQRCITRARKGLDRALCSLPITQHSRVWKQYMKLINCHSSIPAETLIDAYQRYLKLEPHQAEEYIAKLKSAERWDEAAKWLVKIVDDESFVSREGRTKHQLWLELCDIITKHPSDIHSIQVERIIRGGISQFTDEVGRLWASLADFNIRRAKFERARDIYHEALDSVVTARDFSIVFDALAQFEENMLSAKLDRLGANEDASSTTSPPSAENFLVEPTDASTEVDLRLARLERLTEKRPELLSSVKLRQNPNNVYEWLKRVHLFEGDPRKQVMAYTEAVKTIDPSLATGRPHDLWVGLAQLYEANGDIANAVKVFERAVRAKQKTQDGLAAIVLEWAELLIRVKRFREAIELLEGALGTEKSAGGQQKHGWQGNEANEGGVRTSPLSSLDLGNNSKVWALLCDMQESIGGMEKAIATYEKCIERRVATPQTFLNFASMLIDNKRYEHAFRVYERGVELFDFKHARELWHSMLNLAKERLGKAKVERHRDMHEQAIAAAPMEERRPFFVSYVKLEQAHGTWKRAMDIYERAIEAISPKERMAMLDEYVKKAMHAFGVSKAREAYDTFIKSKGIDNAQTREIARRYAELEQSIGEIDRARALFSYGSQFASPKQHGEFWDEWHRFEVSHGSEDTFRDMLRIKRAVAASFANTHFNMQTVEVPEEEMRPAEGNEEDEEGAEGASVDPMDALERQGNTAVPGFVSNGNEESNAGRANPEELDIG